MQRTARSIIKESLTKEQFEHKAFFNVHETEAAMLDQYGNWSRIPDKKVLIREDGSYVSTVGRNYSIVDNQNYFEGVIQALTEAEIDYIPKQVYVEGNGRRTNMVVELPKFSLYPNSTEEQRFELRIRNSFDTTMAADTVLGFLRLVCTNGMTAFDTKFNYRMIHKGDITSKAQDAIELFKTFEGTWERNKRMIEHMGNSHGNRMEISRYIGNGEVTLNPIFKGERWAAKLQEKWQEHNETTNLWDLYNMFTYIISHEYGHSYSSKLNKMEELNKDVKRWNNIFLVNTMGQDYI